MKNEIEVNQRRIKNQVSKTVLWEYRINSINTWNLDFEQIVRNLGKRGNGETKKI